MKKFFAFLALLCFSAGFTQEVSGYYISLGGTRVEGYFKKTNYSDTRRLEFKEKELDPFQRLPLEIVSEYGMEGLKFVKATVDVDVTGGSTAGLGSDKDPAFEKRTVFLEVLVESNASLYVLAEGSNNRFFYAIKDKNIKIKQLVYKKYLYNGYAVENMLYKQQLAIDVICPKDDASKYVKLQYAKSSLVSLFQEYNRCTGFESVVSKESTEPAAKFTYAVTAGGGIASTYGEVPADFSVKSRGYAVFVGAETELKIKYSGFSMIGKFQVQKFTGSGSSERWLGTSYVERNNLDIDVTELNFNLGGRYTIPVSGLDRIFAEISILVSVPVSGTLNTSYGVVAPGSGVQGPTVYQDLSPKSNFWINLGAGAYVTKKLAVGIYCTPRRSLFVVNDFRSTVFTAGLKYSL